jgi:hypothetical protein
VVRRARPRWLGLEPQLGLRAYRPGFDVAPLFAADVTLGRFALGASYLTVAASERAGEVHLGVAAAGLAVRLVCHEVDVRVCLDARADAGLAWADAEPVEGVSSRSPRAPYLALAARGSLGLSGARLIVDLGWAEGLVTRSDTAEMARAAGAFVGLGLGVRLW